MAATCAAARFLNESDLLTPSLVPATMLRPLFTGLGPVPKGREVSYENYELALRLLASRDGVDHQEGHRDTAEASRR